MASNDLSIMDLFQYFGTDEAAEDWFVRARWPKGLRCAYCDGERVTERGSHPTQPFRCSDCRKYFSVKANSVLESSKLGYQKLAVAYYLFVTRPKGISSMQLAKDLKITQKSAWFLGHRIRLALENDPESLFVGPVEVDEVFIGGRARNQTSERKRRLSKTPVIGMRDRATNLIKTQPISARKARVMQDFVYEHTTENAEVYTDEASGYRGIWRAHRTVNHSAGEYGLTNGIESHWALLRRAYYGTYHQLSKPHLHRYTTEMQERHNRRSLGTEDRMKSVVADGAGKRLRYVDLVREGQNETKIDFDVPQVQVTIGKIPKIKFD